MTAVLTQLHPSVAWRHGSVTVTSRHELRRDLAGEGLVFMPSLFQTGRVSVVLDPPWQPTLIYPARGPGRLAAHAPDAVRALAGVFGTARAAVLSDVAEPASTTELARRHGRSPGSVSAHLSALRAAGLVTARRVGRVVLYELTPLGHAVVGAAGE
jgi:DNA-binding transcriptional ArsR family regulator